MADVIREVAREVPRRCSRRDLARAKHVGAIYVCSCVVVNLSLLAAGGGRLIVLTAANGCAVVLSYAACIASL
jgi:hypothetical protein